MTTLAPEGMPNEEKARTIRSDKSGRETAKS